MLKNITIYNYKNNMTQVKRKRVIIIIKIKEITEKIDHFSNLIVLIFQKYLAYIIGYRVAYGFGGFICSYL